jgi:Bacteriophage Sf6, terminase small subunit-like
MSHAVARYKQCYYCGFGKDPTPPVPYSHPARRGGRVYSAFPLPLTVSIHNMDKAALALHGSLNGGSKPKLTKSLAKQICNAIAKSSLPIAQILESNPNWPTYDEWRMAGQRLPWLRSLQLRAREEQADYLAQDCMKLEHEMLEREEPAMPWVQARKVVMEQRRWYAGKVYRSAYGDDPALSVNAQVNVSVPTEKLQSIRERLEAARTLVPPRGNETPADVGTDHPQLGDAPPATDYVSTTNVTATFSGGLLLTGKAVELLVTAHVVSIGYPTILSMTWQDTYRIVPGANGPVTFPGVVLATGRTSGEPPAGTTWPAIFQERLYSSSGRGVPTVFELRVDGVTFAEQTFFYFASYSGGPPPEIRP